MAEFRSKVSKNVLCRYGNEVITNFHQFLYNLYNKWIEVKQNLQYQKNSEITADGLLAINFF